MHEILQYKKPRHETDEPVTRKVIGTPKIYNQTTGELLGIYVVVQHSPKGIVEYAEGQIVGETKHFNVGTHVIVVNS